MQKTLTILKRLQRKQRSGFIKLVLFVIAFILFVGLVMYFAADTINELKEKSKE